MRSAVVRFLHLAVNVVLRPGLKLVVAHDGRGRGREAVGANGRICDQVLMTDELGRAAADADRHASGKREQGKQGRVFLHHVPPFGLLSDFNKRSTSRCSYRSLAARWLL